MPPIPPYEKDAFHMAIRIHKDPTNPDYERAFKGIFKSVIACLETDANRPHLHIVGEIDVLRSNAVRDLIKKQFGLHGNGDFGVKNVKPTPKDYDYACNYCCKGDDPKRDTNVTFNTPDWSAERVACHKLAYWRWKLGVQCDTDDTSGPIHVVLNVPQDKVKKQRTPSWTELWIDKLACEYPDLDWDYTHMGHRKIIYDHLLKNLGQTRKNFNANKITEFMNNAFNTFDAHGFRDAMWSKVKCNLA